MVKPDTGQAKFSREGDPLGLAVFGLRRGLEDGDAVGQVERGAEAVGQPGFQPLAHHDPVDHHVDVVAEVLVELGRVFELVEPAVDLDPLEALLAQLERIPCGTRPCGRARSGASR